MMRVEAATSLRPAGHRHVPGGCSLWRWSSCCDVAGPAARQAHRVSSGNAFQRSTSTASGSSVRAFLGRWLGRLARFALACVFLFLLLLFGDFALALVERIIGLGQGYFSVGRASVVRIACSDQQPGRFPPWACHPIPGKATRWRTLSAGFGRRLSGYFRLTAVSPGLRPAPVVP